LFCYNSFWIGIRICFFTNPSKYLNQGSKKREKSFLTLSSQNLTFLKSYVKIFFKRSRINNKYRKENIEVKKVFESISPFLGIFILNSTLTIGLILNQNESIKDSANTQSSSSSPNPLENLTWFCLIFQVILFLLKIKENDSSF
jgi:hypothetical protein